MSLQKLDSLQIIQTVHETLEQHGASKDELIPVLFDVNQKLGYLPTQALTEIGKAMRMPVSQVLSVASFYTMLSTQPRGRHVIQFCESAPCHVMGGRSVVKEVLTQTGVKPGEISPDGRWTVIMTSCLGTCGVGPVMVVDDDVYGNLSVESIAEILAKYE